MLEPVAFSISLAVEKMFIDGIVDTIVHLLCLGGDVLPVSMRSFGYFQHALA